MLNVLYDAEFMLRRKRELEFTELIVQKKKTKKKTRISEDKKLKVNKAYFKLSHTKDLKLQK